MKLADWFNKILNKVGADKVLHRLVGSDVTFCVILIAVILFPTITFGKFFQYVVPISGLLVLALGVAKEIWDDNFDLKDLRATMRGWLYVILFTIILIAIAP